VLWEGHLVFQHIYNAAARNKRFIPVLLGGAKFEDIPTPLQGVSHYRPETNDGYEALYRRITGQPRVVKPPLGTPKRLPSDTVGVWPTAALSEESPSKPSLGQAAEPKTTTSNVWFSVGGYLATFAAALFAYVALDQTLEGKPVWLRPAVALTPLALVLFGHTIPALIEQRRRIRLKVETGDLKPGYFRLSPRDDEKEFARADNKHDEILRWLKEGQSPVLYLTGEPGSGKSSILLAWVIPKLSRDEPSFRVIQLRGYQDPLAALESKLREPGIIWGGGPPPDVPDIRELLELACRDIQPQRLLIIFDQFEEFVILHGETQRQAFEQLLASFSEKPIHGLTLLLVLRSDYVEVLENLTLPKLVQDTNWKAVPPFTERAARGFLRGSGLKIDDNPAAPEIPVQIAHLAGAGPGYADPLVDDALGVFVEAITKGDHRTKNLYFDVTTMVPRRMPPERRQLVATRIRQLGLQRILYGSDAAVRGNLPPKEGWEAFRSLPLSEEEFRTIAGNVPPYFR
jgi:hypothetical protein